MAKKDKIVLAEGATVEDSEGNPYRVTVWVNKDGYIPDVYVDVGRRYEGDLADDRVFVGGVMSLLAGKGYTGEEFERAELGMQGANTVVLEPGKDFNKWIEKKGWIDKSKWDKYDQDGEGLANYIEDDADLLGDLEADFENYDDERDAMDGIQHFVDDVVENVPYFEKLRESDRDKAVQYLLENQYASWLDAKNFKAQREEDKKKKEKAAKRRMATDLRDDYDEKDKLADGVLYRKGKTLQVWWEKDTDGNKFNTPVSETWILGDVDTAKDSYNEFIKKWK